MVVDKEKRASKF